MNRIALCLAVAGFACSGAHAQTTYNYSGPVVAIPDSPDGTCGTPASVEINVSDTFTVGGVKVGFYMPHPWQGDVTVSLTHVSSGRTAVLVDRPGNPVTLVGFGSENYGTSGAFFELTDSGSQVYDEGGSVTTPGIPNVNGAWKPESALATFTGVSASGKWRLTVRDCAGIDTGSIVGFRLTLSPPVSCYANCDGNPSAPYLTVADFTCFLYKFANGDAYANCDASVAAPTLNVADFTCFLNKFASGCTAP